MYICPRRLTKDFYQKYGHGFATAALSEAHRIMLKETVRYKRLHILRYKHEHTFKFRTYSFKFKHSLTFKILFWLCNIFDSYHAMKIDQIELAESLLRYGEVKWMVKIPGTVMSYRWMNWHQYKLEENSVLY